jgi:hypothetical protein
LQTREAASLFPAIILYREPFSLSQKTYGLSPIGKTLFADQGRVLYFRYVPRTFQSFPNKHMACLSLDRHFFADQRGGFFISRNYSVPRTFQSFPENIWLVSHWKDPFCRPEAASLLPLCTANLSVFSQ